MEKTRADLVAHLGGTPTTVQMALIERAVQLTLRLALMDQDFAQSPHMSDHGARVYIAWSNALARTLSRIGLQGAAQRTPTLDEVLRRPREAVAA